MLTHKSKQSERFRVWSNNTEIEHVSSSNKSFTPKTCKSIKLQEKKDMLEREPCKLKPKVIIILGFSRDGSTRGLTRQRRPGLLDEGVVGLVLSFVHPREGEEGIVLFYRQWQGSISWKWEMVLISAKFCIRGSDFLISKTRRLGSCIV